MASKGKGARDKGAAFERLIVRTFKEAFADQPWASSIRRGKQSHAADECDVTGVPGLWVECQHADVVTPLKKLEQAERDLGRLDSHDLPLVVTRKTGSRAMMAHMAMLDLVGIDLMADMSVAVDPMVTLSLADFIALYRAHRCS